MRPGSVMAVFTAAFVAASPLVAADAQNPAPQPVRIRGEVAAFDAEKLVVHRRDQADLTIAMKPAAGVGAVRDVKLADVKPGTYVGVASVPDANGDLVAREVLVFPEAMRGSGEGHSDWDLLPGSKMTNANVTTAVERNDGRELTLSYPGGSKVVRVPAGTPVVTFADATRADIVPGRKVFVVAMNGPGGYEARRVIVEKDGVAPPM